MPIQAPALPTPADPIDETFLIDPLDPDFDEQALADNVRFLIKAFRAEIEEYNLAQSEAKEKGTKASGANIKKRQKAKLTELEQKLLADTRLDAPTEELF